MERQERVVYNYDHQGVARIVKKKKSYDQRQQYYRGNPNPDDYEPPRRSSPPRPPTGRDYGSSQRERDGYWKSFRNPSPEELPPRVQPANPRTNLPIHRRPPPPPDISTLRRDGTRDERRDGDRRDSRRDDFSRSDRRGDPRTERRNGRNPSPSPCSSSKRMRTDEPVGNYSARRDAPPNRCEAVIEPSKNFSVPKPACPLSPTIAIESPNSSGSPPVFFIPSSPDSEEEISIIGEINTKPKEVGSSASKIEVVDVEPIDSSDSHLVPAGTIHDFENSSKRRDRSSSEDSNAPTVVFTKKHNISTEALVVESGTQLMKTDSRLNRLAKEAVLSALASVSGTHKGSERDGRSKEHENNTTCAIESRRDGSGNDSDSRKRTKIDEQVESLPNPAVPQSVNAGNSKSKDNLSKEFPKHDKRLNSAEIKSRNSSGSDMSANSRPSKLTCKPSTSASNKPECDKSTKHLDSTQCKIKASKVTRNESREPPKQTKSISERENSAMISTREKSVNKVPVYEKPSPVMSKSKPGGSSQDELAGRFCPSKSGLSGVKVIEKNKSRGGPIDTKTDSGRVLVEPKKDVTGKGNSTVKRASTANSSAASKPGVQDLRTAYLKITPNKPHYASGEDVLKDLLADDISDDEDSTSNGEKPKKESNSLVQVANLNICSGVRVNCGGNNQTTAEDRGAIGLSKKCHSETKESIHTVASNVVVEPFSNSHSVPGKLIVSDPSEKEIEERNVNTQVDGSKCEPEPKKKKTEYTEKSSSSKEELTNALKESGGIASEPLSSSSCQSETLSAQLEAESASIQKEVPELVETHPEKISCFMPTKSGVRVNLELTRRKSDEKGTTVGQKNSRSTSESPSCDKGATPVNKCNRPNTSEIPNRQTNDTHVSTVAGSPLHGDVIDSNEQTTFHASETASSPKNGSIPINVEAVIVNVSEANTVVSNVNVKIICKDTEPPKETVPPANLNESDKIEKSAPISEVEWEETIVPNRAEVRVGGVLIASEGDHDKSANFGQCQTATESSSGESGTHPCNNATEVEETGNFAFSIAAPASETSDGCPTAIVLSVSESIERHNAASGIDNTYSCQTTSHLGNQQPPDSSNAVKAVVHLSAIQMGKEASVTTQTESSVPTEMETETSVPTPPPGTESSLSTEPESTVSTQLGIESSVPTQSETETSVPTQSETETSVPTQSETETSVPTQSETETSVPTQSETETSVPTQSETESSVPTQPETESSVPTQPETESSVVAQLGTNTESSAIAQLGTESSVTTVPGTESSVSTQLGTGSSVTAYLGTESSVSTHLETESSVTPQLGTEFSVSTHLGTESSVTPQLGTESSVSTDLGTESSVTPHLGTESSVSTQPETECSVAAQQGTKSSVAARLGTEPNVSTQAATESSVPTRTEIPGGYRGTVHASLVDPGSNDNEITCRATNQKVSNATDTLSIVASRSSTQVQVLDINATSSILQTQSLGSEIETEESVTVGNPITSEVLLGATSASEDGASAANIPESEHSDVAENYPVLQITVDEPDDLLKIRTDLFQAPSPSDSSNEESNPHSSGDLMESVIKGQLEFLKSEFLTSFSQHLLDVKDVVGVWDGSATESNDNFQEKLNNILRITEKQYRIVDKLKSRSYLVNQSSKASSFTREVGTPNNLDPMKVLTVDSMAEYFQALLLVDEAPSLSRVSCMDSLNFLRHRICRILHFYCKQRSGREESSVINAVDILYKRFYESFPQKNPKWSYDQIVRCWDSVRLFSGELDECAIKLDHEKIGSVGFLKKVKVLVARIVASAKSSNVQTVSKKSAEVMQNSVPTPDSTSPGFTSNQLNNLNNQTQCVTDTSGCVQQRTLQLRPVVSQTWKPPAQERQSPYTQLVALNTNQSIVQSQQTSSTDQHVVSQSQGTAQAQQPLVNYVAQGQTQNNTSQAIHGNVAQAYGRIQSQTPAVQWQATAHPGQVGQSRMREIRTSREELQQHAINLRLKRQMQELGLPSHVQQNPSRFQGNVSLRPHNPPIIRRAYSMQQQFSARPQAAVARQQVPGVPQQNRQWETSQGRQQTPQTVFRTNLASIIGGTAMTPGFSSQSTSMMPQVNALSGANTFSGSLINATSTANTSATVANVSYAVGNQTVSFDVPLTQQSTNQRVVVPGSQVSGTSNLYPTYTSMNQINQNVGNRGVPSSSLNSDIRPGEHTTWVVSTGSANFSYVNSGNNLLQHPNSPANTDDASILMQSILKE